MKCISCKRDLLFSHYIVNKYGSGKEYRPCVCGMGAATELKLNRNSDLLDAFVSYVQCP